MSYEKFTQLTSTAYPLPVENVDTDQIIPARFLKAVERKGFGDNLFRDWRYDRSGQPKPDFVLNDPRYSGKILIAGKNFGSGSSREHAAWALYDFGLRAVVSSFFADIFRNNALNNGILPVVISPEMLQEAFKAIEENPVAEFRIDLQKQELTILSAGKTESFDINPYKKHCLMNGLDDIDFLVSLKSEIDQFEKK
ncbi:MAG TPA: 3-isopropylmalate dehydratase small subunit [Prolixibacteraceae bacterium]|nr:3-isopropylmalate dehydratase small subunit [Prolixibacteraceae bacterium]